MRRDVIRTHSVFDVGHAVGINCFGLRFRSIFVVTYIVVTRCGTSVPRLSAHSIAVGHRYQLTNNPGDPATYETTWTFGFSHSRGVYRIGIGRSHDL